MINIFTVTWPTPPNIVFKDGVDGLQGLKAEAPTTPPQAGALFTSQVRRTNLNGGSVFIQNLINIDNGYEEHHAGWVYTQASGLAGKNDVPKDPKVGFPFVDYNPNQANPPLPPAYNAQFTYIPPNDADTQSAVDIDAPETGNPANPDQTAVIDVRLDFRLYLAWQYPSGIYYPIANIDWQVIFYANKNAPNKGVTYIVITNGVSAGNYKPDNTVPGAMAPPTAGQGTGWQ